MRTKKLNIIVAVDKFGGFSKNGEIPWIKEDFAKDDLKNFKKLTDGNIVIMGRKTYQDIANHCKTANILPNRDCFILSKSGFKLEDNVDDRLQVVDSIRSAMNIIKTNTILKNKKVFIIGGEKLFIEAFGYYIDSVYLTYIDKDYECDKYFPIKILSKRFEIVNGKSDNIVKYLEYKEKS